MITWNTGRWYTEAGQRMAAAKTAEGGIMFVDVDRMIEGYIASDVMQRHRLDLNRTDVMWAYDHHDESQYWVNMYGQDRDLLMKLKEAARAVAHASR